MRRGEPERQAILVLKALRNSGALVVPLQRLPLCVVNTMPTGRRLFWRP
jgi:hypothetical protein